MFKEVEVEGKNYRIGKLDAMKQWNVSRRVGPILVKAFKELGALPDIKQDDGLDKILDKISGPIINGLSEMSDTDSEYVIFTCLAVVQLQQGDAWAPIVARGQNRFMFDEIDMKAMLVLTGHVLMHNLSNFFSGNQPKSNPTTNSAT